MLEHMPILHCMRMTIDADSAYAALMGSSTLLYSEQASVSMCDDLIGDELAGTLHVGGEEEQIEDETGPQALPEQGRQGDSVD